MVKAFRALVAGHKGEATAEVTVAEQLKDEHLAALRSALKAVSGKDVDLAVTIDPAIIGGLVVKLGSRMVDSATHQRDALRDADERGPIMDIRAAENLRHLQGADQEFLGQDAEGLGSGRGAVGRRRCRSRLGLDNVQAGEMVEFESGVRGIALNLETDNVGVGSSAATARSWRATPSSDARHRRGSGRRRAARPGRRRLRDPIDGRGPIKADIRARVDVKAPRIIPRSRCTSRWPRA